jgi:phosphoglycerate dehydrogenase-like enzyme
MPKVALIANPSWLPEEPIAHVYGEQRLARLRGMADVHPMVLTSANLSQELPKLAEVEALFSTWGMIALTPDQIAHMPKLKAVFYAAGAAGGFAGPFIDRGISVCSAVEANAIPVAEFCLGQILLSCKGYFANTQRCRDGIYPPRDTIGRGVYGETVALLGIGAISRHLLRLLAPMHLQVVAVSNYLAGRPESEVRAMGIERLVSLEEAFAQGYVVSNHLPDKPGNKGIIGARHFASMRPGATFINTGRGAQVDEAGMVEVLARRTDLTALLDVTHPEPPVAGSPLNSMPNIFRSSHIAGSANDEVRRLADWMIDDFERMLAGKPLQFRVDPTELATRA